jgi:hypothetical protein
MPGTKLDGRSRPASMAARRDDELIARAAKRTGWAGAVLESAARDLGDAHGDDGNGLTGVAEVVLEEAARVCHLSEDIRSLRAAPDGLKSPEETG